MTSQVEAPGLQAEDYQAIEDAVMETARGRWFLAEHAKRHRAADTTTIVATLERLERTIKRDRQVPDIDRIRLDLADMAEAIFRTKQEIAQMKIESDEGGRFAEASHELDAIVSQTELATNDILHNAEKVQELAWTLRENGVEDALCDRLDHSATEIYMACSFQDLTGQRTRKVVTVLRYLESRINSMIGIWGLEEGAEEAAVMDLGDAVPQPEPFDSRPDAHLLNGPPLLGEGIDQSAVDDLMDEAGGRPESLDADVAMADAGEAADPGAAVEAVAEVETVSAAEPEPGLTRGAEAAAVEDEALFTDEVESIAAPAAEAAVVPDAEVAVLAEDEAVAVAPAVAAALPHAEAMPQAAVAPEPEPEPAIEAAAETVQEAVPAPVIVDDIEMEATAPVAAAGAEAAEPPLFSESSTADVFASPLLPLSAEPGPKPVADVFAPAPEPAPVPAVEPAPKPAKARKGRGGAAQPLVVGNTALAVEAALAPAVVAVVETLLAVVPQDDPIAALSPQERLIVFG